MRKLGVFFEGVGLFQRSFRRDRRVCRSDVSNTRRSKIAKLASLAEMRAALFVSNRFAKPAYSFPEERSRQAGIFD